MCRTAGVQSHRNSSQCKPYMLCGVNVSNCTWTQAMVFSPIETRAVDFLEMMTRGVSDLNYSICGANSIHATRVFRDDGHACIKHVCKYAGDLQLQIHWT